MGAGEQDFEAVLGAEGAARPQAQRAHALLVAGMHRTGTSALTRVLSLLGIDLPRHPVPGVPHNNDLGFWESVPISRAHDRFLASVGSGWDDVSPIPSSVFASAKAEEFAAELAEILKAEYGDSSLFVVKDPRLCRLIPIWTDALESVGARPSFMLTTRNPLEVAASLKERDGFGATKSCLLWLRHLLDAERDSRGFPRVFVSYERLLRDWVATTDRIAAELHLFWPRADHEAHLQVDEFLSTALRHHSFDYSELRARSDVTEWIKQAYDAVSRAAVDAGEVDTELFDEIRSQLDRADHAYGPLLAQARVTVAERDAALTETQTRLEEVATELAARQTELANLNLDNTRVTARLVEEIETATRLSTILEGLSGALARLGDGLEELTTDVAAGELEPSSLRAELERLLDELQSRPTAATEPTELASAVDSLSTRFGAFLELLDDDRVRLAASLVERDAVAAGGEEELQRLETELREVSAALGEREAALAVSLQHAEGLEASVTAQTEELRAAVEERQELLEQRTQELERFKDEARAVATALGARDSALTDALALLEDAKEQVASQRAGLEQRLAERDEEIAARTAELEALSAESERLSQAATESAASLAGAQERLEGAIAASAKTEQRLREQLEQAFEERNEFERDGVRLAELLSEREEILAQRTQALEELAARDTDRAQELEQLQTATRAAQSALGARDAALADALALLEDARSEVAASQSIAADLEQARAERDARAAEGARLEGLLAERGEELDRLRSESEALTKASVESAAQVADAVEARDAAQAEQERISAALGELEATLAESHTSLDERNAELEQALAEREAWLGESDRVSQLLIEREEALAVLRGEQDGLRAEAVAKAAELVEVAGQLAAAEALAATRGDELQRATVELDERTAELERQSEARKERESELAETRLRLEAVQLESEARVVELQAGLKLLEGVAEERISGLRTENNELGRTLGERQQALQEALADARALAAAVAETEELLAQRTWELAERKEMLVAAQSELGARDELLARRWQQLDRLSADVRERDETLAVQADLLARLDAIGRKRGRRWRSFTQFLSWLFPPTAEHRGYLKAYRRLRHSDLFDADFYLSRYPDVAHTGLNPLMHYIEHGRREGRQPIGAPLQLRAADKWAATSAAFALPDEAAVADLFPALPSPETGVAPGDADLATRLRGALGAHVPASSVVAVATGGDERLLALPDCATCHFPRTSDGAYGGNDATGDTALIANLEATRAAGADFLLVPASQRSLLDRNPHFRAHVFNRYWRALESDELGICFALFSADSSKAWRRQLGDLAEWIDRETGREASILDWESGLRLAEELPGCDVFSVSDPVLPHVDGSVDVVAVVTSSEERLAEAARVARHGVLEVPADGSPARLVASASFVANAPTVSIIIPCHEEFAHTQACVRALGETLPTWFRGEIIIVDDASGPGTVVDLQELASTDSRVVLLRNEQNVGFLGSVNRAAQEATGEFLVLLNNDTIPLPGWLPPLLAPFHAREDVGATGGRLVYPDGRLQEAGGLVFQDGSAAKFGYGDPDPDFPLYTVPREVDYVSGCLLAFRRDFFLESGAFDPQYGFGFYEDTDFCFRVRSLGKVVLYEPESTIVHVEGASAGTDLTQGAKRFQAVNADLFLDRWREALARQPERPAEVDLPAPQNRESLRRLAKREATTDQQ